MGSLKVTLLRGSLGQHACRSDERGPGVARKGELDRDQLKKSCPGKLLLCEKHCNHSEVRATDEET